MTVGFWAAWGKPCKMTAAEFAKASKGFVQNTLIPANERPTCF